MLLQLPKWCVPAMYIGGILFLLALFLQWRVSSRVEQFNSNQQSYGGLGELFGGISGKSQEDRDKIVRLDAFRSFIWWAGLITWGSGMLRWGYWSVFQRPRFTQGPVTAPGLGFVYYPPPGWVAIPAKGEEAPYCIGPQIGEFTVNTVLGIDATNAQSLQEALQHCEQQLTNDGCTGFRWLSVDGFSTTRKIRCHFADKAGLPVEEIFERFLALSSSFANEWLEEKKEERLFNTPVWRN